MSMYKQIYNVITHNMYILFGWQLQLDVGVLLGIFSLSISKTLLKDIVHSLMSEPHI